MADNMQPVADVAALDAVIERSSEGPVLLFNYDQFCPINARAYKELAQLEAPIDLIDVARQHEVKHAVAERTGVRHESPQLIIVRDRQAVWSASHFAITAAAVTQALQEASARS